MESVKENPILLHFYISMHGLVTFTNCDAIIIKSMHLISIGEHIWVC